MSAPRRTAGFVMITPSILWVSGGHGDADKAITSDYVSLTGSGPGTTSYIL